MYAQVEKPKENKSRAIANSVAQKKDNSKQGFGFVDNRPVSIVQLQLNNSAVEQSKKIVQRTIYPPKPEHITQEQMTEWNGLLATWGNRLEAAEEDWISTTEGEMYVEGFDYDTALDSLKTRIKNQILQTKISEDEANEIGWGDILGVIRQIEGTCTVNISVNVDYDGGKGDTWYVKGNTTEQDQRGGWKYNARLQRYLPNARTQVKAALRIHNEEVDVIANGV